MTRVEEAYKNKKLKTLIDFDTTLTKSTKPLAVKKQTEIKVTTRFSNGKMLFSKISLTSFVYDMVNVFCFPNNEIKEIYKKNEILKCFLY